MADTLSLEELRRTTGYTRVSDVERCLRQQNIRFFWGKDGPWTTIDLVNAAGGLAPPANDGETYGADVMLPDFP
jgi:hypothetical protein